MNEFKFTCPTCGQHILANEEWVGRPIDCPSCKARITIPPRPKAPKKGPTPATPAPTPQPKASGGTTPAALPAEATKTPAAQTAGAPSPPRPLPGGKPAKPDTESKPAEAPAAAPEPVQPRIAALTPAIKLDMVRTVRRRIAAESAWLPARIKGANAYAAKTSGGETVLLDPASPEATRFSLIGAFLLEFQLRHVVRTAAGRTRLLDQEIPGALREALLREAGDEQGESAADAVAHKDLATVSHAQCLAALDVLEERYSERMQQTRVEQARDRLEKVSLADLVNKLEAKARIEPEEVATALYHEMIALRRRLDRLEDRNARNQ